MNNKMLRILLFFLSFILSDTLNGPLSKKETYTKYKKTNGFDHRPKNNYTTTSINKDIDISKIRAYFEKKWIINTLQNPNIPISKKLFLIRDDDIKSPNLISGGLMDHFDFDFDFFDKPTM